MSWSGCVSWPRHGCTTPMQGSKLGWSQLCMGFERFLDYQWDKLGKQDALGALDTPRHKSTVLPSAALLSNCISAGTWRSGKNTRSLSRSLSSCACSSSRDVFACSSRMDCSSASFSCCSVSSSSCVAQQGGDEVCRREDLAPHGKLPR